MGKKLDTKSKAITITYKADDRVKALSEYLGVTDSNVIVMLINREYFRMRNKILKAHQQGEQDLTG